MTKKLEVKCECKEKYYQIKGQFGVYIFTEKEIEKALVRKMYRVASNVLTEYEY